LLVSSNGDCKLSQCIAIKYQKNQYDFDLKTKVDIKSITDRREDC